MRTASRSAFLGAFIFATAAVAATLATMWLHGVPPSDRSLSDILWIRSLFCLAAGLSAALSYLSVRRFDWRLRREPLLGRAFTLGVSTVAVGHLLIGFVYGLLLLAVNLAFPKPPFWDSGNITFAVLGMGLYAAAFGWYLTLPLGIVAAALVEWLERRRRPSPGGPAKAVG